MCAAVTGASAGHDDVGVLAATALSTQPEPLTIAVPATPEYLGKVRKQFSSWLAELQAGEDDMVALELSTVEAVTNSIEHAYTGPPGMVCVDAVLDRSGTVRVVVSDDGRWKTPPADPGFRGRGLIMMREFSDQFRLDTSARGTTVTLEKTLRRTISLDAAPVPTKPLDGLQIDIQVRQDAVIISLAGALDSSGVDFLQACLVDAERIEALPLIVNLDNLSLLASAGLCTLYEHADRLRSANRAFGVVAAAASMAREVLRISGLEALRSPADGG
jgi:anti-anti-sigma factor